MLMSECAKNAVRHCGWRQLVHEVVPAFAKKLVSSYSNIIKQWSSRSVTIRNYGFLLFQDPTEKIDDTNQGDESTETTVSTEETDTIESDDDDTEDDDTEMHDDTETEEEDVSEPRSFSFGPQEQGGQFNRHFELWAQNRAQTWAKSWAKFSIRALQV